MPTSFAEVPLQHPCPLQPTNKLLVVRSAVTAVDVDSLSCQQPQQALQWDALHVAHDSRRGHISRGGDHTGAVIAIDHNVHSHGFVKE